MNSLTLAATKATEERCLDIPHDKLERLLTVYGIAHDFIAFSGETIVTPIENRLHILACLGVSPATEEEVDRLLEDAEAESWLEWMKPVVVTTENAEVMLSLQVSELERSFQWCLDAEDAASPPEEKHDLQPESLEECGSYCLRERHYRRLRLPLGRLEPGYYCLRLSNGDKWLRIRLIVAPPRCHEPPWLVENRRIWGVSCQLYTLREADNWGIGDFADLKKLITQVASRGGDFILLNPLHALSNQHPQDASPYSPVDRRFLNPLYIRPEDAEDFASAVDMEDYRYVINEELAACRDEKNVAYARVFHLKYGAFQGMYLSFCSQHLSRKTPRAREFRRFVKEGGAALKSFAQYQAKVRIHAVPASTEVDFHLYLQWLASLQLEACQQCAADAGMKIGLIRDLAVGGTEHSCEVSMNQDLFCLEARIGAPPDYFNPDGQNWGLPPLRPDRLEQSRFTHFIDLLRTNMAACGALRIDHVMALMRLWWCPNDGSNANGAYVRYPVDALFAILRLESQRARCVIIGEDLGVVPPEIRGYLDGGGLLSNVVFYFEKYDGWHFRRPEHFKPRALAFAANHDCPPLRAWWDTHDVTLRRQIGLIRSDEQAEQERAHRLQEKEQILALLKEYSMLPESWLSRDGSHLWDMDLAAAIFRWCGSYASVMLSVQLDDIAGLAEPINIPGTSFEYANWSRKIPVSLEELFSTAATGRLLDVLNEARP